MQQKGEKYFKSFRTDFVRNQLFGLKEGRFECTRMYTNVPTLGFNFKVREWYHSWSLKKTKVRIRFYWLFLLPRSILLKNTNSQMGYTTKSLIVFLQIIIIVGSCQFLSELAFKFSKKLILYVFKRSPFEHVDKLREKKVEKSWSWPFQLKLIFARKKVRTIKIINFCRPLLKK